MEGSFLDIENIANYGELLQTKEWRLKRQEILIRDGFRCTNCKKLEAIVYFGKGYNDYELFLFQPLGKMLSLHVHHKVYREGMNPIKQPNEDLTTLCKKCHEDWHKNNNIVLIGNGVSSKVNRVNCERCEGNGHILKYKHVMNGICFNCWGIGLIPDLQLNLKKESTPTCKEISDQIMVKSNEVDVLIHHFRNFVPKNILISFLEILRLEFENFKFNNYDENLFVSICHPSDIKKDIETIIKDRNEKLYLMQKLHYIENHGIKINSKKFNEIVLYAQYYESPILAYNSGDTSINRFENPFVPEISSETPKNFLEAKKYIDKQAQQIYLPVQMNASNLHVNARYFRKYHSSVIYKMTIDESFRTNLLNKIYE